MIFVIDCSCLSRGPDDQGLSLRPGVSSSSGKGLSKAALKRLKSGEGEEEHCLPRHAGATAGGAAGYGPDGEVERRRTARPVRPRAIVLPPMK
jgi:hypothetical protein